MDYDDWTEEELEARLEEVRREIEGVQNAHAFQDDLEYFVAEGFIELEVDPDGVTRAYPKEQPSFLSAPWLKP